MSGINIEKVDHIGIRVRDLDRALAFYQVLGFKLAIRVTFDPVAIIRNEHGVEINLILNADAGRHSISRKASTRVRSWPNPVHS